MIRAAALGALLLAPFALTGCLGDPPIEERWTLLEVLDASPTDANAYGSGPVPVTVRARITYREILTGFLVAEIRQSDSITALDTRFEETGRFLDIARDVDLVLASSTALGTATVAVTGFDHLMQEITLSFDATPAQIPQGSVPRATSGLFLVVYFSDDVDEVEIAPGEEVEIVHPVLSTERNILSSGLELVPESSSE